jgi:hypothetical protein
MRIREASIPAATVHGAEGPQRGFPQVVAVS